MEKLSKLMFIISLITLVSCEKKYDLHRGYSYPIDNNNPTSYQHYGNILIDEHMSDNSIISKIKETKGLTNQEIIFLNSEMYWVENGYNTYVEISDPDPKYMIFPYMLEYNTDSWNYDYLLEYIEVGEEVFCNKYLNGQRTLGMELSK